MGNKHNVDIVSNCGVENIVCTGNGKSKSGLTLKDDTKSFCLIDIDKLLKDNKVYKGKRCDYIIATKDRKQNGCGICIFVEMKGKKLKSAVDQLVETYKIKEIVLENLGKVCDNPTFKHAFGSGAGHYAAVAYGGSVPKTREQVVRDKDFTSLNKYFCGYFRGSGLRLRFDKDGGRIVKQ